MIVLKAYLPQLTSMPQFDLSMAQQVLLIVTVKQLLSPPSRIKQHDPLSLQ